MNDSLNEFNYKNPQNEQILKVYEKDNYLMYDTGVDSNTCYIFFSSNGLYYPETAEVFQKEIVEKDRYEWK